MNQNFSQHLITFAFDPFHQGSRNTFRRKLLAMETVEEDTLSEDDQGERNAEDNLDVHKVTQQPMRREVLARASISNCGGTGDAANLPVNPCHQDMSSSGSDSSGESSDCDSEYEIGVAPPLSEHSYVGSSSESDSDNSNASSVESTEYLYEGSDMTSNQGLLEVLNIFVEEGWSQTSLNKNVKLLKKLLPKPNDLPSNGKATLKRLETLTVTYHEKEHLCCSECFKLVPTGDNNEHDEICTCVGEVNTDKFYSFDPDDQVRHMFEQRNLASVIDHHRNHHDRKEGFICDVQDGSEYKAIKQHLKGPYDFVGIMNTDGVQLSGSSKQELWAFLGIICEVPPRLRSSFMIVFGVYVGKKDPDMNVFLKPFVDSLKKISENGGVTWVHPVSQERISSMVVFPKLCADAPAKAMVLKQKRFNSKYGCNVCEQRASLVAPEEDEENNGEDVELNRRNLIDELDRRPSTKFV